MLARDNSRQRATSVVDRLQASKIETNLNKPAVGYFVVLHIAITIKGIVTRTPPVAFVTLNYEPLRIIRMFFVTDIKNIGVVFRDVACQVRLMSED